MATNKNEQKFYNDVSSIEKSLKRIANALEDKQEVKTKDIPLTITNTLSNKDEDYGDDEIDPVTLTSFGVESVKGHSNLNASPWLRPLYAVRHG